MRLTTLEAELLQVLRMDHESREALAGMLPDDLSGVSDDTLAGTLADLEQRGLVHRLVVDIRSHSLVAAPGRRVADPSVEWWALTPDGRALAASDDTAEP